jgi:hypothetical protein
MVSHASLSLLLLPSSKYPFTTLSNRLEDTQPESSSSPETEDEADPNLACAELVALDVDHDRHMKHIVRMRYAMNSEGYWTDVSPQPGQDSD